MDKSNEQKITVGLLVSWALGLLCLLAGVGALLDEGASISIVFFVLASVLLPPVRKFAYKRTGKTLSAGVRIITVLVLLTIAGSMVSGEVVPRIRTVC